MSRSHPPPLAILRRLLAACGLALLLSLTQPVLAHAQVDINHADAKTLASALNGVGLVKAEAIVAWRERHGPFQRVEDLRKVHGIGPRTVEANRAVIVVGPTTPLRPGAG